MGIWIRSQDRKVLIEVGSVRVDKENNAIIGYGSTGYIYALGLYSTEDKATEVINRIHDFIDEPKKPYYRKSYSFTDDDGIDHYTDSTITPSQVYQMPLDEEVKE